MHYIGMDCHITTLDFAVVNEAGRLVKAHKVPTSVNGFMEFVKTVPPPRTIYMEEGTLAAWALETCVRFREKLVITDAKKNHWIGSSGQKGDLIDALKLAHSYEDVNGDTYVDLMVFFSVPQLLSSGGLTDTTTALRLTAWTNGSSPLPLAGTDTVSIVPP